MDSDEFWFQGHFTPRAETMKSVNDCEDNSSTCENWDTDSIASDGELQNDTGTSEAFGSNSFDTNERLPFIPEWIFGLSCGIGVSSLGSGSVCYAASHFVVISNYENHTENLLVGHKNAITSISTNATRKLLATADAGNWESFILLWKTDKWTEPIARLKPPSPQGTRFLALSQEGKYLITVSEGLRNAILNLWEISKQMKPNEPLAVLELSEEHGRAREVTFCRDCTEFSMITCTRNVFFLNWMSGHWLEFYPEQMSHSVGRFNSSIYISGTARAATITSHGCVLIWAEKLISAQPLNQKVNADVIKLEHPSLTTICETDGVIVVGDKQGQIRFYDQTFKTLFFWFNLEEGEGIKSMSFVFDPEDYQERKVQLKVPLLYKGSAVSFPSVSIAKGPLMVDPRSIKDTKNLRKCLMGPQDMNAHESDDDIHLPFVPRDVILHTLNGRTSIVSIRHMRCVTIKNPMAKWTCATTHPTKPHLITGNATGELRIFNYKKRVSVLRTKVWHAAFSSIRISPDGHTLMVGSSDGMVLFIHPLLINLHSNRGIHHRTLSSIWGPVFSNDSKYFAHYDDKGYVSAYRCLDRAKNRWLYLGKKMIHQQTVRHLLFGQEDSNAPLYSIGEDRMLIEYDVVNSIGDSLLVKRSDLVSMGCTSNCMMWCPAPPQFGPSLLISYSEILFQCKTNVINLSDRSNMITANGPFFAYPISSLLNLRSFSRRPHTSEGDRVAVFITKYYMGLMKCPPEGSPFSVVATFGHHVKIDSLIISGDQKYAFTLGKDDTTVAMYRINLRALELRMEMSSPGLEPYLGRLEGGREGWLFQEMIHAFCYAQILHQSVKNKTVRDVGNSVPLCEIPDLMRAVGVFSSQFAMNSINQEIVWKGRLCTGTPGNSVTFEDFVKLAISHYPGKGIQLSTIKAAFDEIGHAVNENESVMSRDRFISSLTEKGEAMTLNELKVCLVALLGKENMPSENEAETVFFMDEQLEREKMFTFLPDDVTYSYLIERVLGIIVENS